MPPHARRGESNPHLVCALTGNQTRNLSVYPIMLQRLNHPNHSNEQHFKKYIVQNKSTLVGPLYEYTKKRNQRIGGIQKSKLGGDRRPSARNPPGTPVPSRPPYCSAPRGPGGGQRHSRRHAARAAHAVVSSPWRWGEAAVAVSRSWRSRCCSGAAQAR